jgi:hypothetical protein
VESGSRTDEPLTRIELSASPRAWTQDLALAHAGIVDIACLALKSWLGQYD